MRSDEASKIVAVILAAYPAAYIPPDRVIPMREAYRTALHDLTYEQADRALRAVIETSPKPPSPSEIRRAWMELQRGNRKTGLEAWGTVVKAMSREGAYRKPGVEFVFGDKTTARVVDAMGWEELCLSENTVADRARFIEAYEAMALNQDREDRSPTLAQAAAQRTGQVTTGGAVARVLELARGRDGDS